MTTGAQSIANDSAFDPVLWYDRFQAHLDLLPVQAVADQIRAYASETMRTSMRGKSDGEYSTWADMEEQIGPIEWIWQGWLPRGMLVIGKEVMLLNLPVREERARVLVKKFTR